MLPRSDFVLLKNVLTVRSRLSVQAKVIKHHNISVIVNSKCAHSYQ